MSTANLNANYINELKRQRFIQLQHQNELANKEYLSEKN
jgi:hypothetical protein